MKTIDDVLKHPENQVDPIIRDTQDAWDKDSMIWCKDSMIAASSRSIIDEIHKFQYEYNLAMARLQLEMELEQQRIKEEL